MTILNNDYPSITSMILTRGPVAPLAWPGVQSRVLLLPPPYMGSREALGEGGDNGLHYRSIIRSRSRSKIMIRSKNNRG